MRTSIISTILIVGAALAACADPAEPVLDPGDLLTRSDREPAGANCAEGGTAVRIGHDADHDGELDDGEVERVEYVCKVSTPTLVRQDPVPAGAVCPGGGTAVHTGRDLDGDGVLDDEEIENTVTVCDVQEIWTGDILTSAWDSPEDEAALAQVRVIDGNLIIDTDVALPALELVGGQIAIEGGTSIQLPALRQVVGKVLIEGASDSSVSAPVLGRIGADLKIVATGLNSVSAVMLPGLQEVGGTLEVHGALTTLALPTLGAIGGSLVLGDGELSDVQLDALTTIGGRLEVDAPALDSLDLDSLVQVGEDIEITFTMLSQFEAPALLRVGRTAEPPHNDGLTLVGNPVLSTIALPALFEVEGSITVSHNDALTALQFPSLVAAPALTVEDSGVLTEVRAPRLASTRDLHVTALPQLITLDVTALTKIEQKLQIRGTGLPNLSGLASLTYALSVELSDDDELVDLHGLEQLDSLGGIVISRCDSLVSLAGLDSLVHTTAFVFIRYNPVLADLGALSSLTYVGGTVLVEDNDALVSLAGLDHVAAIGDGLLIIDNGRLANLSLGTLTSLNGSFTIQSNPVLPVSEIARLQAQVGR